MATWFVSIAGGEIVEHYTCHIPGHRRQAAASRGSYELNSGNTVGFKLAAYDTIVTV